MKRDLFSASGNLYRGNLHGHSTFSDGKNTPGEAVRLYREAGYDFICLSDHFWSEPRFCADRVTDSSSLDSAGFITIISAELHCPGKLYDQDNLWHIVANGLPLDFPMATETETGPELVQRAVKAGAFVTIPHPEWYSLTSEEARSLAKAGAHGVEIYNHASAIGAARGGGVGTIDQLANEGFRVTITATDDSHQIPDDAFGGWVMVAAKTLSADAIVASLKAGKYYSSCGPDFTSIQIDGNKLNITSSPVSRVTVAAGGHRSFSESGKGLTNVTIEMDRIDFDWIRIELTDEHGLHAWSNIFWLDDKG